jgi:hypothetical protein
MRNLSKVFLAAILALVVRSSPATAALVLTVSDGTNTFTVTDVDNDGSVVFSGVVGNFNVTIASGLSDPLLGTKAAPFMDIAAQAISGAGTLVKDTLTITLQDTDFTTLGTFTGINQLTATSLVGTITQTANYSASNLQDPSTLICAVTLNVGDPQPVQCSGPITNPKDPYSLELVLAWTPGVGGALLSADGSLKVVPEPASMLLFGLGLAGLGFWGRKRLGK